MGVTRQLTIGNIPGVTDFAIPIGREKGMAKMRIELEVDVSGLAKEVSNEHLLPRFVVRGARRWREPETCQEG
jgi:hypothetical protein